MIYTHIPYAPKNSNKNLGKAYNDFMNLLQDDDWAVFLDHDALFTTPDWYSQIEVITQAIDYYKWDVGVLTAVTNRIGNEEQIVFPKNSPESNNHDILFHRKIGEAIRDEKGFLLRECIDPLSGVVIIIKKSTWNKTTGFDNGFLSVDNKMDYQLRNLGYRNYIIEGLYVYHVYRADAKQNQLQPNGYTI